jgi:hypothetical protein
MHVQSAFVRMSRALVLACVVTAAALVHVGVAHADGSYTATLSPATVDAGSAFTATVTFALDAGAAAQASYAAVQIPTEAGTAAEAAPSLEITQQAAPGCDPDAAWEWSRFWADRDGYGLVGAFDTSNDGQPHLLCAGGTLRLQFRVTAPSEPGTYTWTPLLASGFGAIGVPATGLFSAPADALRLTVVDDDVSVLPGPPITRDLCPPDEVPSGRFADVAESSVHAAAIDCLLWREVTAGTTATTYGPAHNTTRGQMASLVARAITHAGGSLPPATSMFTDEDPVHGHNISRLAAAGIVQGVGEGRFAPHEPIRRDQMATLLVNAHAYVTGQPLAAAADAFTDDNGNVHEANINAAAEAGLTLGRTATTYAPAELVRRDQMASFLVRLLALMLEPAA